MGSTVMRCAHKCVSSYQDTRYGAQNRVHNRVKEGWACTVCSQRKKSGGKSVPTKQGA